VHGLTEGPTPAAYCVLVQDGDEVCTAVLSWSCCCEGGALTPPGPCDQPTQNGVFRHHHTLGKGGYAVHDLFGSVMQSSFFKTAQATQESVSVSQDSLASMGPWH
jgi:hypothetical protein